MRDHDLEQDPPSADIQAGEYVLGVLDAAAMREVRRRMARDPAFARLVDDWSERLAPLNDELDHGDVPAHVWPRIRTRLGWNAVQPVQGDAAGKLSFWRGAAAAGFAMAAALAVVAVMRPTLQTGAVQTVADTAGESATPQAATDAASGTSAPRADAASGTSAPRADAAAQSMPQMPVTQLVDDAGAPTYLATIDPRGGGMWLVPMPGTVAPGARVPVLWLIPKGQAPRALGFVDSRHSHWVDVPAELRAAVASGSVLAITFEAQAAAPPTAPTSSPVATGGITL